MPASTNLVIRETPALESKIGSVGGSRSDVWNDAVLDSLQMAIPNQERLPQEVIKRKSQAMLDALMSLKPRDEIEGMVMAQMIAIQEAIMECFRRAWLGEHSIPACSRITSTRQASYREPIRGCWML